MSSSNTLSVARPRLPQPLRATFFYNDTAPPEIYTLSLHDALPISGHQLRAVLRGGGQAFCGEEDSPGHGLRAFAAAERSEEHTSELQSHSDLVCRLLLEKKKNIVRLVLLVGCGCVTVTARLEASEC